MIQIHSKSDPEKNAYEVDARALENEEYPVPTQEEVNTLRKVPANLPIVAYSLCLVEFAERASYYGAQTVFSNFIEFSLPKGTSRPGHSYVSSC